MTALRNREARLAEYERLAAHASALAEASTLAHVREKHELAAAQWRSLAGMQGAAP